MPKRIPRAEATTQNPEVAKTFSRGRSLETFSQAPRRICSIFKTSLFSIIRFSKAMWRPMLNNMLAAQFSERWPLSR
jgi:hypothetical protein